MIEPHIIEEKIRAAIEDAHIEVLDLTGTKDHYQVLVVSSAFEGKPLIKRHRMIYDALAEEMKGPIHALTLQTYTPDQVEE
ncbi:MAG: BolA family protein [Bradymonadaceae bacterium]